MQAWMNVKEIKCLESRQRAIVKLMVRNGGKFFSQLDITKWCLGVNGSSIAKTKVRIVKVGKHSHEVTKAVLKCDVLYVLAISYIICQ